MREASKSSRCTVLLVLMLAVPVARADSWDLPTTKSYLSPDKTWRFTVTPRAVAGPLAYFRDKVAGRKDAGALPGNLQKRAQGFMEHRVHGHWQAVWNRQLLNEVSPVSAVVSPSGQVATFDNWFGNGIGDDVVVIYGRNGRLVRAMALKEFLPARYVDALPRSVSSIWWGGDHHFSADGRRLILSVVVPDEKMAEALVDAKAARVELAFDTSSGKELAPPEPAWSRAVAQADQVDAALHAAEARREAVFVAPLRAPHGDADADWHRYLAEAFFRIDPDWENGYPATKVLRLPQRKDYAASVGFLRDALHKELYRHGVTMIASPSQDNLVRVLARLAAGVPHGWLRDVRIYVAVDDAHTAAVARALAPTGARYVQLNPDIAIPQRRQRLDAMRAEKQRNDSEP